MILLSSKIVGMFQQLCFLSLSVFVLGSITPVKELWLFSSNCSNIPTISYKSSNWKRDMIDKRKENLVNRWNIPTIYP